MYNAVKLVYRAMTYSICDGIFGFVNYQIECELHLSSYS